MSTVVVDYGSGNLRSAAKALERAAAEAGSGGPVEISGSARAVREATRVVLPGVGAFADCRAGLHALPDMVAALTEAVTARGVPFLGICVGMQLMAGVGREHGDTPGLGWIPGEVVALSPADPALKVPHMGWNELLLPGGPVHPVLAGLPARPHAYFVHGYHMVCHDPAHVLARVDHGGSMAAVVGRDNMIGTQFHPEKSQAVGLRVLRNFLEWRP